MKAIAYGRPVEWRYTDAPDPSPGPGEIRLKVVVTGVCGTDVHLYAREFGPTYPLTPDHEIVGVIDGVGGGMVGRLSTHGLVTHRFGLPDCGRAIDAVAHDSSCIKAVIAP